MKTTRKFTIMLGMLLLPLLSMAQQLQENTNVPNASKLAYSINENSTYSWTEFSEKEAVDIYPYRSFNDGRNMRYTVIVYYTISPMPGFPIGRTQTIVSYPFSGRTGTEGEPIFFMLESNGTEYQYCTVLIEEVRIVRTD